MSEPGTDELSEQPADKPFDGLTPDVILDAVESLGLVSDARLLALNSFENRVYQVGVEDATPVIAKFYRPGRWDDATIVEEHRFAIELNKADLPVVAPLAFKGATLHQFGGHRFTLFPRRGGHAAALETEEQLRWMARVLGRMHARGAAGKFDHRPSFGLDSYGHRARQTLAEAQLIFDELRPRLLEAVDQLLSLCQEQIEQHPWRDIRLHGDCHRGNVLWRDGPLLVDLDDCINGPAIWDIWMLLSGDRGQRESQLQWISEEYRTFANFPFGQVPLVETCRGLRMVHHQAWVARRWDDPAFPHAFPQFAERNHWQGFIGDIWEQIEQLRQPPLQVMP